MTMRWSHAGTILLAITLAIVGCKKDGNGASSSSGGTIVFGHVASKTGDTATFGLSADEGIRLALDEINSKGGVLGGRKLEVLTEDDRSLGDEAKTAANKLITRNHVCAILGEIA